jgi:ABC-2 type transport system ATP-binding protein
MASDAVIAVDGLRKTYRSGVRRRPVQAVKGLSLTVRRGSIVAFVGPNGAGKTTTIHTVLGFLKPDEGSVRVFGEAPGPSSARRIGYQPEIFHTYPFYKAREALRFYGKLSGMSREALDLAVPERLEQLGLREAADRPVSGFSKGMTQRLGLAQALVHDPELLILDEPTSGLDPEGRRLVLDIIGEQKARGKTVFLSSHILPDVERTCDEVVMVMQGQVVLSDRLSSFGAGQHWEIEVTGWTAAHLDQLRGHVLTVAADTPESALLVCDGASKQALLRALTSLSIEIGTVQRSRGTTLEDTYLKHAGSA